jgi:Dolichyl-phosphate-mannose-protein mannosyltransferase
MRQANLVSNFFNRSKITLLIVTLMFVFHVYFSVKFYFRFITFTEGWWHVYEKWLDLGFIPYRDFELLTPPLYIYILHFIDLFINLSFYNLRIIGLFLIFGMSLILFLLFRKICGEISAALISLISIFYLQTGVAFIPYDYVYFALALLLASVLSITRFIETQENRFLIITGVFLGLSFLVKQSFASTFSFLLLISLVFGFGRHNIFSFSRYSYILLGSLSAISPFIIFFLFNGALLDFLNQAFFSAISTKGSFFSVLTQWLLGYFSSPVGLLEYAFNNLHWLLLILFLKRVSDPYLKINSQASLALVTIFILFLLIYFLRTQYDLDLIYVYNLILNNVYVFPFFLSIFTFILSIRSRKYFKFFPISIGSLGIIWGTGMSAGLTEIAMFFALGSTLVILSDFWQNRILSSSLLVIIFVTLFINVPVTKTKNPFSWWGYSSPPINSNQVTSQTGLTKNLKADYQQLNTLMNIEKEISKGLLCKPSSVVFPHMPLFQLDTNSLPNSGLAVSWFDFSTPESLGAEIKRIKNDLPGSIVIIDIPSFVWEGHSRLFNDGKSMPQKIFLDELKSIILSMNYTGPKIFELGNDYSVQVHNFLC